MDCLQYRPFWIRWENGVIQVGQGAAAGDRNLAECVAKSHSVDAISLSSDKGSTASWLLEDRHGLPYVFYTQPYGDVLFNDTWVVPRQQWLGFQVVVSEWAVLALCDRPFSTTCYQLHISKRENNIVRTFIVDGVSGNRLAEVATPGLLTEAGGIHLYVDWFRGYLNFGRGENPHHGMTLLRTPSHITLNIEAVGFATPRPGSNYQGNMWLIPRDQVLQLTCHLPAVGKPQSLEVATADLNTLVFSAKQDKGHLRVTMYSRFMSWSQNPEYSITVNHETKAVKMWAGNDRAKPVMSRTGKEIMSGHSNVYWLSWLGDFIRFGQYGDILKNTILEKEDPDKSDVMVVLLWTDGTSNTQLMINQLTGNTYNVITDSTYGYNAALISTQNMHIVFRLRTCNDGHVLLRKNLGQIDNTTAYEIVFGGSRNTNLMIRKGTLNSPVAWIPTNDLVNCYELRTFWIRWSEAEDGLLEVGTGAGLSHVLLAYRDPAPIRPLTYVTFSSWNTAHGEWELQQEDGEQLTVFSPADDDDSGFQHVYVITQGYNYVVLSVQACMSAHVALSEVPGKPDFSTYDLELGHLQDGFGLRLRASEDEDWLEAKANIQYLDCEEFKDFWIWWEHGVIQVGTGTVVKKNGAATFRPVAHYHPHGVSFRTGSGQRGEWLFVESGRVVSSSGLSGGAIFGIVFGCLALVVLIGAILMLVFVGPVRDQASDLLHRYSPFGSSTSDSTPGFENPNFGDNRDPNSQPSTTPTNNTTDSGFENPSYDVLADGERVDNVAVKFEDRTDSVA